MLVRGDGSTAHEGIFDLATGEFLRQTTQQGFRGDSCWSRGLAWAMYGFAVSSEYSRDPRFLETAEACTDYYITHTPHGGVPPWDYNAPAGEPDTAGYVRRGHRGAGMLRLCRLVADPIKGHLYWSTAIQILRSLCTHYLAAGDAKWEGILKGGVYHLHKGLGVDESVTWGEYFFVKRSSRHYGFCRAGANLRKLAYNVCPLADTRGSVLKVACTEPRPLGGGRRLPQLGTSRTHEGR